MISRAKKGATNSTGVSCTRFETHPYRRTSLCKNCSRTLEQHGEQSGKEEEERKNLEESEKLDKEKIVPEQGVVAERCPESGGVQVSSHRRELVTARTATGRTNGKPNNEVRSSRGQPASANQVKVEPEARIRKCNNPAPNRVPIDSKVKGKAQVTESKVRGHGSAAETKAKTPTIQAETPSSQARANSRAVNEVRSKTGQASKQRTPKSRDTGKAATPNEEKRLPEMTRCLSSPSDFDREGVPSTSFSSSSTSSSSSSSSSSQTQAPLLRMDLGNASVFRRSRSLDATSVSAETGSETRSEMVTCTTGTSQRTEVAIEADKTEADSVETLNESSAESLHGFVDSESDSLDLDPGQPSLGHEGVVFDVALGVSGADGEIPIQDKEQRSFERAGIRTKAKSTSDGIIGNSKRNENRITEDEDWKRKEGGLGGGLGGLVGREGGIGEGERIGGGGGGGGKQEGDIRGRGFERGGGIEEDESGFMKELIEDGHGAAIRGEERGEGRVGGGGKGDDGVRDMGGAVRRVTDKRRGGIEEGGGVGYGVGRHREGFRGEGPEVEKQAEPHGRLEDDKERARDTEPEQHPLLPLTVSISLSPELPSKSEMNESEPKAAGSCFSISFSPSKWDADKKAIYYASHLRQHPAARLPQQPDQSVEGGARPNARPQLESPPGAADNCGLTLNLPQDGKSSDGLHRHLTGAEVERDEVVRPEVERSIAEQPEVERPKVEQAEVKPPEVVGYSRQTEGDIRGIDGNSRSSDNGELKRFGIEELQRMNQQQQQTSGAMLGRSATSRDDDLESTSAGSDASVFDVEASKQTFDAAQTSETRRLNDNGIEGVAMATVSRQASASNRASPEAVAAAAAAEADDQDKWSARDGEIRNVHIPMQLGSNLTVTSNPKRPLGQESGSTGFYGNGNKNNSNCSDEWDPISGTKRHDGTRYGMDVESENTTRLNNVHIECKEDEGARDEDSAADGDDDEIGSNLRRVANRFRRNVEKDEEEESRGGRGDAKRNSIDGEYIEKLMAKVTELEQVSEKLNREKSALADLMGVKNTELEEERHHYGSKIQDLEDETLRLRTEKARLLKLFQLPESDRVSMSAMENELEDMRKKLAESDTRYSQIATENEELRLEVKDLELEMQELHDQFQQEESAELRELRKELENTARDIRLLHFKLRKSERRNDELKSECEDYEEKLRKLEERGRSGDEERRRIRKMEDDLRTAKEVSIKMHDECQRMEREQRKMTRELEELRRENEMNGSSGVTSPNTSSDDVRSRNLNGSSLRQQSLEAECSLTEMLERVAEAAKKRTSEVADADVGNCLRLCHELEMLLRDNYDSSSRSGAAGSAEQAVPSDVAENGTTAKRMLSEDAGREDSSKKEEEDELERRERENELRLQLALADEESKILRRKLAEMRGDNDNLMRAVEYLRKKLEQSDASSSPPVKHKDRASPASPAARQDAEDRNDLGKIEKSNLGDSSCDSKDEEDTGGAKRSRITCRCGGTPADGRYPENSKPLISSRYYDNEERKRSQDADKEMEVMRGEDNQRMKEISQSIPLDEDRRNQDESKTERDGVTGGRDREDDERLVLKWKNRTMELQNEIVLLTEELQTTMEENEKLTKEVTGSRKELENMLETLRRKERQFAEERKVLKRRNNDLSKMFDLLTERTKDKRRSIHSSRGRGAEEDEEDQQEAEEERKKRRMEDRVTQTDRNDSHSATLDQCELSLRAELDSLEKQTAKLVKEKTYLEHDLKAKDEIIRSREDVIKRKDFLLGRAVKSLQDLEASVEEKMNIAAEKDEELKKMETEWKRWKERVEALEKELRKTEEKLKTSEGALKEREAVLEKVKDRVSALEVEIQSTRTRIKVLEESLQVKDSELRSSRAEQQRTKADLDRVKVEIQELEMDRDGLLREKRKLLTDASKEKERLDLEKRLAQKERQEMETNWKRIEERWTAEREEMKTNLGQVEEKLKKLMSMGWTKRKEAEDGGTEVVRSTKETQTIPIIPMEKPLTMSSAVYSSVAKANVIHIPVMHETSSSRLSSSPAALSSASLGSTAAASASAAAATGASGSADASRFHRDADARTGTGRDIKVHGTQHLYRTTEELNPVSAIDLSSDQPRSRLVSWSSSTDQRTRRSGRTASVDRYGPSNVVPVSHANEFVSFQSLLTDSTTGRQLVQLHRGGNRTPSAESCNAEPLPVRREDGSVIEVSRDHSNDDRKPEYATPGAGEEKVICFTPDAQHQELESESADVVAQATPKFRRHDKKQTEVSDSPAEFRRRSRSMSEFDVFSAGDDLLHVVQSPQPVEMIPYALSSTIPQSTPSSTYTPSAYSSATAAAGMPPLPNASPDQSITTGVVLRQKRIPGIGSCARGSFYTSGSMSASASREISPVRFFPPRRITPYPVPPPSMIISPARTPLRASSTDRSGRIFSQGDVELLQRKLVGVETEVSIEALKSKEVNVNTQSDVPCSEDTPSVEEAKVELGTDLGKGRVVELAPLKIPGFIRSNDFYHSWNRSKFDRVENKGKKEKRSVSVSPRTARKKFFDNYPYHPPPGKEQRDSSRRYPDDEIAGKERQDDVIEAAGNVVEDQANVSPADQDSGFPRKAEAKFRRIALLSFSTLPFFRKKAPVDAEQRSKKLSRNQDSSERPVSAMATSAGTPKSSRTLSRLQLPKFSTTSSRNSASPSRSSLNETRDQEGDKSATGIISELSSMHTGSSVSHFRGLQREPKENQEIKGTKEVNEPLKHKFRKETQGPKEPKELKSPKETKEGKESHEQKKSVGPKESFEPIKPKLELKTSDSSLQTHTPVQQTSTQSLFDYQHSNSVKFQRIMKPFRKLGMGGSGIAGSGDMGRPGSQPSKPIDRHHFPTFQTLNESTMRSISLSSDLMKEMSAGYGQPKVFPRAKSEDETEEKDIEGLVEGIGSKSLSTSYAHKMAPDEAVKFRSLDRKKKSNF